MPSNQSFFSTSTRPTPTFDSLDQQIKSNKRVLIGAGVGITCSLLLLLAGALTENNTTGSRLTRVGFTAFLLSLVAARHGITNTTKTVNTYFPSHRM